MTIPATDRPMVEQASTKGAWKWIAIAVLIVPTAFALFAVLSSTLRGGQTIGPVQGVVLGHGPAQVRDRLETGVAGSFRSTATGEDFALDWTPDGAPGPLRSARLEFHLGQLVAVRMLLSPDAPAASGPEFELSEGSVLTRRTAPDGAVELDWLARSCPTHADEVRQVLAERR